MIEIGLKMAHPKGPCFDTPVSQDSPANIPCKEINPNSKKMSHRDTKDKWNYGPQAGSNSLFHVPMPGPPATECKEGLLAVSSYADSVQDLCRAGTCAADRMSMLLAASSYGEIAGQLLHVQHHLEENMAEVKAWLQVELEAYIKQLGAGDSEVGPNGCQDTKAKGQGQEDPQVMGMGLMLFVELQQQFFQNAAQQLNTFVQKHAPNMVNGLVADNKLHQSCCGQSRIDKHPGQGDGRKSSSHGIGSPSRLRKQLASFLSRRKNLSNGGLEPSQTAWYVNMDSEAGQTGGPHPVVLATREGQAHSAGQMSVGLDSHGPSTKQVVFPTQDSSLYGTQDNDNHAKLNLSVQSPPQFNGGLAAGGLMSSPSDPVSQEELDVVIDMLSRATKYTAPVTSCDAKTGLAPAGPPPLQASPLGSMSKAPGSHLAGNNTQAVFSTSAMTVGNGGHYGSRAAQHRQSDGFITDLNISRESKTNTWPTRPRQRDTSAMGLEAEYFQPQHMLFAGGMYDVGTHDAAGNVAPPAISRQNPLMPGFNPGPWSTGPEDGASKGWPAFPNIPDGETVPRQWTIADSSSCSDESSSNGELQWMMAMNLMESANMQKRRHSSGGEDSALTSGVGANNSINKSIDSLMEPKSTNTWPPKHPWVSKPPGEEFSRLAVGPDPGVVGAGKGIHRPLMPQWSDPLAARPLAVWDGGLPNSLSQQNFSTLPAGGMPADYSPATRHMAHPSDKQF